MDKEREEIDYIQICACSSLRKTTRVVTQLYDKLLQPTGLKVTQYAMLVNILRHQAISISQLGEVMLLDQTTVTRNVSILQKSGYVTLTKDKQDARAKVISPTAEGLKKIKEAQPIWLQIQERIVQDIGKEQYQNFLQTLNQIQQLV